MDDRLTVNENDVAAEVMEGEAIIINLATGVYYSMDGAGGVLWSMVEEGRPLRDVVEAFGSRYGVERERAAEDVLALAERILEEGLVETAEGGTEYVAAISLPEVTDAEYRPPRLEVYRDMEELLALDPPMPGLDAGEWEDDGAGPTESKGSG